MSGLWTPSGEHRPAGEGAPAAPGAPGPGTPGPEDGVTDEEIEALREVHRRLRATPAADIVANHAVQLFQLAVIYLGLAALPDEEPAAQVPDLPDAGLAIDAMAAVVDTLGARLGGHEGALREALTQVQLAYARAADATPDDPTV